MRRAVIPVLMIAAALPGCSSGSNGLSTASVLGTAPTPPAAGAPVTAQAGVGPGAAAVPVAAPSDPTGRAFQVGSVTARAAKCGYNFDGARLRAAYLAHEIGLGATNESVARLEKIHDVAYNGVMKAASGEADYCSERKTQEIKTDLNRLLAGDFEPPRRQVAEKKEEGGLFSGWFDGSSGDSGPKFGSGDWWEKQQEKAGR